MERLRIRCEACEGAIDVPDDVRLVTCQACGAGLVVVREGGAAYTRRDSSLSLAQQPTDRSPGAAIFARASRTPRRGAALFAGFAMALTGAGYAAVSAGAGLTGWSIAGALVTLAGIATVLRAARLVR